MSVGAAHVGMRLFVPLLLTCASYASRASSPTPATPALDFAGPSQATMSSTPTVLQRARITALLRQPLMMKMLLETRALATKNKSGPAEKVLTAGIVKDATKFLYYVDKACNVVRMERGVARQRPRRSSYLASSAKRAGTTSSTTTATSPANRKSDVSRRPAVLAGSRRHCGDPFRS